MEQIKNISDFLNAEILLKDSRSSKLELNLKDLLSKESFSKTIKENVTKDNEKENKK